MQKFCHKENEKMNEKGWKIIVSCTPFALKSVLSTFYYVMFVVFVVLSSISSGFLGRAGFLISLSKSVFSCMVLQGWGYS